MNRLRRLRALALCLCLVPAGAQAAGYGIYEQGAAALGMAGAYVASAHDASAQFYNPAALTRLEGSQLSLGGTWLTTRTSFAGVDPYPGYGTTEAMENGNFFPPTFYWTNHLGSSWAYGVGLNSPFGLGVEWQDPASFTGRQRVTKALLQTVSGSLSLAWAPSETWSFAGGANALFAKVELNNIGTFITDGGQPVNVLRTQLKSELKPGYGMHLAMLGNLWTNWRLGVTYRTRVEVKVEDGKATFEQILTGAPALDAAIAAGKPANQTVATDLVFPAMFTVALAWRPAPDWTYEIDGVWTEWSAFDKLPLRFPGDPSLDQELIEDYNDTFAVRVGAEHRMEGYTWRAGYYFDPAAAPVESVTPLLPDASRHGATLGLGLQRGNWSVDAYNLFLFVDTRSTELRERGGFDGVYKSYVNALGATLAYRW